ncbi:MULTISPECIES: hypothetical protein [unclassified Streptomyces]|uniref:hypothetical protein n=1 Tax=unclassified Streptomyces TaxID=2593676 RepID=UPI00332E27EA
MSDMRRRGLTPTLTLATPPPQPSQPVSPRAAAVQLLSDRDAALRAEEESLRTQRRQIQEQHDGLAALMPVHLQARQHAFPQGTKSTTCPPSSPSAPCSPRSSTPATARS